MVPFSLLDHGPYCGSDFLFLFVYVFAIVIALHSFLPLYIFHTPSRIFFHLKDAL